MKMIKQGSRDDYNYKEFMFDSSLDSIDDIDTSSACEGSVAFDMNTGEAFMLNSEKEWKPL